MLIAENRAYRFDPPVIATGIIGEGDETRQFPGLKFTSGTCIKLGEKAHQFIGLNGGVEYKFFTHFVSGGSKVTPL